MTGEKAETKPITLYPTQRSIVEAFAAKNGRSFSNAVQFIIEEWQRVADPEGLLLNYKPQKRTRRSYRRPAKSIEAIPGVQKGIAE